MRRRGSFLILRFLAVFGLLIVGSSLAALSSLNQTCRTSADCAPKNSYCRKTSPFWPTALTPMAPMKSPSPTLGLPPAAGSSAADTGSCWCKRGYAENVDGNCAKLAPLLINKAVGASANFDSVLGRPCTGNRDCSAIDPNAVCQTPPFVCKARSSFCVCGSDFINANGRCKKSVSYGDRCNEGNVCTDPRTSCDAKTQKCTCDSSSKLHPNFLNVCVPSYAKADFGQACSSDRDCFDDMECDADQCICRVGWSYDSANLQCRRNDIGDDCEGSDDCYLIKYSECGRSNTCECLQKYNRTVVTIGGITESVCLPVQLSSRQLGDPCDESGLTFCRPPLICTNCTADGSSKVCAMPQVTGAIRPTQRLTPPTTTRTTTTTTTTRPMQFLEDPCKSNADCVDIANGVCNGDTQMCSCRSGFVPQNEQSCALSTSTRSTTTTTTTTTTRTTTTTTTPTTTTPIVPELPPRLFDPCDFSYDCREVSNSYCSPETLSCECILGYETVDNARCRLKEAPTTSTRRPQRLNDFCYMASDCQDVSYAICKAETGKCECSAGYMPTVDQKTCIEAPTPKTTPTTTTTSKKTTTTTTAKETVKPINLGTPCAANKDCSSIKDSYCNLNRVCACKAGFNVTGANKCTMSANHVAIGHICEDNKDCSSIANAICDNFEECACADGFIENGGYCERIEATVQSGCSGNICALGAKCRLGFDICKTKGAQCLDEMCRCPDGYKPGQKDDCIVATQTARLGESCEFNYNCYYNLVCRRYECRCPIGMKPAGDYDCTQRTIADPCTYDKDCRSIKNGACLNGVCTCDAGYQAVSPTNCSESIWRTSLGNTDETDVPCINDNDCTGPNVPARSICGAKKRCQCPPGATVDAFQTCRFAPANDFTGWACRSSMDCGRDGKLMCIGSICQKPPKILASSAPALIGSQLKTCSSFYSCTTSQHHHLIISLGLAGVSHLIVALKTASQLPSSSH